MNPIYILIVSCFLGCTFQNQKVGKADKNKMILNRLQYESSPYLLQHASNPVDWYPYGDEALQIASEQNKLMLISIGYSACHWCHVMERECFEDSLVAELMNKHFVNIKVDREERPDIDQVYMHALQLMTGKGGWPLNVICLPDGSPVYGCTYLPPDQWKNVLQQLANLYENDSSKLISYASDVRNGIVKTNAMSLDKGSTWFDHNNMSKAFSLLSSSFDMKEGGFDRVPKFPMPGNLLFLLRHYYHTKDEAALNHVILTLKKMAMGGIYDQLEGGFSRYSTDRFWKVPHFEKMIYDNAQLIKVYSETYKLTGDVFFKIIAKECIYFIKNNMTSDQGTFFSAIDADSEGIEGKFYIWSEKEIDSIVRTDSHLFKDYFNVGTFGRWEGANILLRTHDDEKLAKKHNLTVDALLRKIESQKKLLLSERKKRVHPLLDDKQLISWNGIMIDALISAYEAFGDDDCFQMAQKALMAIYHSAWDQHHGFKHTLKNGTSSIDGFLEDYAWMGLASLRFYMISGDMQWLEWSKTICSKTLENFYDKPSGLFYFTSLQTDKIIVRKFEVEDNVIPSSNSVMSELLFKLGSLLLEEKYINVSEKMVLLMQKNVVSYPQAYAHWLSQMYNFVEPFYEVALTGTKSDIKMKELNKAFLPNAVYVKTNKEIDLKIFSGKNPTEDLMYVCTKGMCQLPVTDVNKALQQIQ